MVWSEEGRSPEEIADLAGCSRRSVFRILAYHGKYGTIQNPFTEHTHGRFHELDMGDINYITSLIAARPKIFLDEIQDNLSLHRGRDVSISTLSRTLHQIQITHKKVASEALERNELLWATWQAEYGDIPAEYCVWLDESSVDNLVHQRQSGWSDIGMACVSRDTFICGQRFSILPALGPDGVVALDIFEGSVNKERFIQFLNEQLVCPFDSTRITQLLIFILSRPHSSIHASDATSTRDESCARNNLTLSKRNTNKQFFSKMRSAIGYANDCIMG